MKRHTKYPEQQFDLRYQQHAGFWHRLAVRIFRRTIHKVASAILSRAYERCQIDSHTLHEMCGSMDRILFPERYRNQPDHADVVQSGNVVGGDIAGRDINKR